MNELLKRCNEARDAGHVYYAKRRAVDDDIRASAIRYVEFMLTLRADKTGNYWVGEEEESVKKVLAEYSGIEYDYALELYSSGATSTLKESYFAPGDGSDNWIAFEYRDYNGYEEYIYIPTVWVEDEEKFKTDMKELTAESRKKYLAGVRKKRAAAKKRKDEADRKTYERLRGKFENKA